MTQPTDTAQHSTPQIPDLPRAITSFGAARQDETLYLFGGHYGKAHHYYQSGQSNEVLSFSLKSGTQWECHSGGPRLQGLALVAVQGRLLRLGGFEARNDEESDQDLWSVDQTAVWDDSGLAWQDASPLGEARSSFDADAWEGRVFAIGGWKLQGSRDAAWCETAEAGVWNEERQAFQWEAIAPPPFQRRALSVACCRGLVYAIGGMLPDGQVSSATSIYDPAEDRWSEGPELPGGEMAGFGTAAATLRDELYVSTSEGQLLRLRDGQWQTVRRLQSARFFHQMVPLDDLHLALIGGANMDTGKFASTEVVSVRD